MLIPETYKPFEFSYRCETAPVLSVILLDWSCRESFHSLDYLNNQTIPREKYEIILIEFYKRRFQVIEDRINQCTAEGNHPVIDKWIILDMPENVYYHKHFMYNVGILASRGEIIVICDSDAIFGTTFLESILNSFDKDRNIVLHLDEVRNIDKRFYPYNNPTIEEILKQGCINWKDGKTTGLHSSWDALHRRNYGACMCAMREDIISIGGADEHIDYLGHICGPYEMTFRLVNAGKKEIWHQKEFIYHVWHPGTDGTDNYLGPHDGKNMSTTALNAIKERRVMSIKENISISKLRLGNNHVASDTELIKAALINLDINQWSIEQLKKRQKSQRNMIFKNIKKAHAITFAHVLWSQIQSKIKAALSSQNILKHVFNKFYKLPDIISNMFLYNSNIYDRCGKLLQDIESENISEIAIFGTGDEARVLYELINGKYQIKAVFDFKEGESLFSYKAKPIEEFINYDVPLVITNLSAVDELSVILGKMGIPESRIVI
ncbi:MAG: glycosyltransferase [Nitrospirae bacterium]|nr:glycosyltransferase [Nitrospirota bacterium]